jgi:hypothetical protein
MVDRPHWLPAGFVLDILDPDVVLLRRDDGSMVGAFSTAGSTPESIRHAAERDSRNPREVPKRESSPMIRMPEP